MTRDEAFQKLSEALYQLIPQEMSNNERIATILQEMYKLGYKIPFIVLDVKLKVETNKNVSGALLRHRAKEEKREKKRNTDFRKFVRSLGVDAKEL